MGMVEKDYRSGEVIVKEGETGKSFFLLLEGNASVYADYDKKDPLRLAVLEPGEFFGEMAIIEDYTRSATVVAKTNAKVVEIPGDELYEFFSENPDQILELMKHLAARVENMTADLNNAHSLLEELRASDEGKKKSLFSKIKKHMDIYQNNKSKIPEVSPETLKEAFAAIPAGPNAKNFRKGMIIFKEDTEGDCMYILHKGRVGFYTAYRSRDEEEVTALDAVSFFGMMGLIEGESRRFSAVSESNDTLVESVRQEDLEQIFKDTPDKVILILRHLSNQIRRTNYDFLSTCKEITETYNNK
ncbi:MAG: cyclic nucleotide-binding domain-containing protein [Clostridiales bacterium]|nr:cyclic nucleotide-binding domain-containing protein [Clostridiales bacterium]MBR5358620.1 cyclic nucleotide-binding domain-containing protein [Clostridiales bacterium]